MKIEYRKVGLFTVLRRAQRAALVRTTTAYRTVAFQALCVVAGRMPLELNAAM